MKMRGQATMLALLMTFIALLVYSGLVGPMTDAVNYGINASNGSQLTNAVLSLTTPLAGLAVLLGFLYYALALRG